jgi:hypothetical protein
VIVIRHLETGERQFVASLDGVDLERWEETTEAVPDDLATRAYIVIDGDLQPKPPVLPLFQYLRLWTPAEALAVEATTNTDLRYAFFLLRSTATVDLGVAEVQQGIALAVTLGILTEARAARIRAGLPPE